MKITHEQYMDAISIIHSYKEQIIKECEAELGETIHEFITELGDNRIINCFKINQEKYGSIYSDVQLYDSVFSLRKLHSSDLTKLRNLGKRSIRLLEENLFSKHGIRLK